jgi:hypothetical protein
MSGPTIIATLEKNSRESVRIALDEYRGVSLVDVRVMAPAIDPTGLPIPTKKGIALRIELLPELVSPAGGRGGGPSPRPSPSRGGWHEASLAAI